MTGPIQEVPIQAVLFDVDDTLVDTRGAFGDAVGAVRRAFLPHVPAEREPELRLERLKARGIRAARKRRESL